MHARRCRKSQPTVEDPTAAAVIFSHRGDGLSLLGADQA